MKVEEFAELINGKIKSISGGQNEVTSGFTCDLLSWVMAKGRPGCAWITVQTHMNVIAVSVLMEMACVILVEGVEAEEASLKKAIDEEMPVLSTSKTAYEVCVLMGQDGVLPPAE